MKYLNDLFPVRLNGKSAAVFEENEGWLQLVIIDDNYTAVKGYTTESISRSFLAKHDITVKDFICDKFGISDDDRIYNHARALNDVLESLYIADLPDNNDGIYGE